MNYLTKSFKSILYSKLFCPRQYSRTFVLQICCNAENKAKENEQSERFDILEELREPELSEEQILQKRFKSRLPEYIYKEFVLKEYTHNGSKYNFEMYRLRHKYARHGSSSQLNPGICWPSKAEMKDIIERDKTLIPSLQQTIANAREARLAEEERKRKVEEEVDKNMQNLDKWISEYNDKIEKKKALASEAKEKRERLIEEISEYLGYEIDPRDPRFQEAVEQKEKERKKAARAKKQQESYDKMIAKLKKMAEKGA